MGVRERFEQSGQKIIDAYSTLQEQIFEVIINTLKESDYKHVDKEDVVLWQAEQLQKLGRLNLQAIKLMAETDGLSQTAIEDLIKFHGLQIKQEIDSKLQHVTGSPIPSSEETELLIKGIVDQTWNDLQNNVNETVNRTYNAVRLQRMKDFDMHLALMSSHPNSRPACAYIQGHVVNLVPPESPDFNPRYDSIYNHDYGEPSGTQG